MTFMRETMAILDDLLELKHLPRGTIRVTGVLDFALSSTSAACMCDETEKQIFSDCSYLTQARLSLIASAVADYMVAAHFPGQCAPLFRKHKGEGFLDYVVRHCASELMRSPAMLNLFSYMEGLTPTDAVTSIVNCPDLRLQLMAELNERFSSSDAYLQQVVKCVNYHLVCLHVSHEEIKGWGGEIRRLLIALDNAFAQAEELIEYSPIC